MRVLAIRASARYEGRIEAELTLSDLILMIRDPACGGDGSVLLHDCSKGLPPRNWMPAGSDMLKTPSGFVFTHPRGEKLEIFIEKIYWEQDLQVELTGELHKLGSERQFSDAISKRLELIEPLTGPLTLIGREVRTLAGPIDILCRDENGRAIVMEVKRTKRATIGEAWQMRRYIYALKERPKPYGILIAPGLTRGAKAWIDGQKDIEFFRLSYADVCE